MNVLTSTNTYAPPTTGVEFAGTLASSSLEPSKASLSSARMNLTDFNKAAATIFIGATNLGFWIDEAVATTPPPTDEVLEIKCISRTIARRFVSPDNQLLSAVRRLASYEDGWHSSSSIAPTQSAIEDAEQFLRLFSWGNLNKPRISPADDGEINFSWSISDLYLDLGFFGDGSYSFFAKTADGKIITGDNIPAGDSKTAEWLSKLLMK